MLSVEHLRARIYTYRSTSYALSWLVPKKEELNNETSVVKREKSRYAGSKRVGVLKGACVNSVSESQYHRTENL